MANPDGALGGTYQPKTDYNRTGATDSNGTYAGATFTGATITGTSNSYKAQIQVMTATGTGSGDATAITIGTPGFISVTSGGASGTGIAVPTGAALPGAAYDFRTLSAAATGTILVYAVGATINGVTGTTGVVLSSTGTKGMRMVCVSAGAWLVTGITTT